MLRQLFRLPLVVVALASLWLFAGDRPREVKISYAFSEVGPTRIEVFIRDENGSTMAALSSANDDVSRPLSHNVFLAKGTYRLAAKLQYKSAPGREIDRELVITGDEESITVYLE